MKFIPKAVSRAGFRSVLKLRKHSPTILVVGGVVGFTATTFMAARASRKVQPVLEQHKADREAIGYISKTGDKTLRREKQTQVVETYCNTGLQLVRIYGPSIVVGTTSAASILYGHKIVSARHVASMVAYSGLMEQFSSYRDRVTKTLGASAEQDIYNGAHGEWVEDPNHKGEYKLEPKFDDEADLGFARPWFDEGNTMWSRDAKRNYFFLKGVQSHMNNLLSIRGHVFLNEVMDALHMPRTRDGQVTGWLYNGDGDNFVDFGFMTDTDPHTVAFRNELEKTVRLNFNIDGQIWDKI